MNKKDITLNGEKIEIREPCIMIINSINDKYSNPPIYELSLKPYKENNEINMSKLPFHLKGDLKVLETSNKERIIAGYASVIEVDQEDQLIPKETLKSGIETLLKKSEYANLMLVHQNIQIGQILTEWGELKTHVDDKGLFIVAKIRDDLKTANEIWNQILEHKINGFSIAAEVLLDHEECDKDKCITIIDKINIFEISVCNKPVNAKSGFIVISKAKDNKEKDVQNINVCEICSNKGVQEMKEEKTEETSKDLDVVEESEEETIEEEKTEKTEETEKTEPVEEKQEETEEKSEEEPETPSIEETIASLSREIESLKGVIDELKSEKELPEEEPEEEIPEEEIPEEEEMAEEEKAEPVEEPEEVIEESTEEVKEASEEEEEEEEELDEYPYPSKKDFDELKKSVDNIIEKLSKIDELEELKKTLKSKDEQICALNKRLETIEKSEDKSKAKIEKPKEEESEEKDLGLIKDPYRTGVLYRDM